VAQIRVTRMNNGFEIARRICNTNSSINSVTKISLAEISYVFLGCTSTDAFLVAFVYLCYRYCIKIKQQINDIFNLI